jgi:hypothetical protein
MYFGGGDGNSPGSIIGVCNNFSGWNGGFRKKLWNHWFNVLFHMNSREVLQWILEHLKRTPPVYTPKEFTRTQLMTKDHPKNLYKCWE